MFTDREIEAWYLGLPLESKPGERTPNGCRDAARIKKFKSMPCPVSDEEAERLYLGLPLRAA